MNPSHPLVAVLLAFPLLSLVAGCGGGGGGSTPPPPVKAPPSLAMSSSTIALSADDKTLVAVNQENGSVSIFDATNDALGKLGEVPAGSEPRGVAVLPNGAKAYVANTSDGTVSVILLASRNVVKTIAVGVEPRAVVASPNGTRVYVANSISSSLSVIDTATDVVTATVAIPATSGTHPRAIAVTSDGDVDDLDEKVYVALFFAEPGTGKTGLDEGQDDNREGRVVVVKASDNTIAATIALAPMADTGFKSNGSVLNLVGTTNGTGGVDAPDPVNPAVTTFATGAFPNQLAGIAVRPGTSFAYVVSTGASPNGPFAFNLNAQGLVSVIDTGRDEEVTGDASGVVHRKAPLNLNQGLKQDTATVPVIFQTNPVALAWTPDGSEAWIAVQGSDLLVRMTGDAQGLPSIDAPVQNAGASIARIDLQNAPAGSPEGKAPRGIVINRRGDRAYVQGFVSRTVSAIDLAQRKILVTVPSARLPQPGTPDATVQLGAELFFTGRGPEGRMSSESWGSCGTCHPDGLSDSVTWMFDGGPRQTISLDGTFSNANTDDHRILNWSAVRDETQDFELNTRNVSGGRGLIENDRVLHIIPGTQGPVPNERNQILQYHQLLNQIAATNFLDKNKGLTVVIDQRRDFGLATLDDGRVYFIGGRSGAAPGTVISSVIEFDPNISSERTRNRTGFTPRHSLGVVAVTTDLGPRIYAIGGYTSTSPTATPSAIVEEYNPAADTWRAVASMPAATAEFGIAAVGLLNKGEPAEAIHVLGGNRGSEQTPSLTGVILKFTPDPSGPGTWNTFSFGITPRRNLGAAAVVRGAFPFHVFAIGGRDAQGVPLATVEAYPGSTTNTQQTDPTNLITTPLTQLPVALRSFGIGTSNNRIYVAGGVNTAGDDQSALLEYNPAANPAGGTAGAAGTPSGAWTVKVQMPFTLRSLQLSTPRPVTNFLAARSAGRDDRQDAINEWVKRAVRSYVAVNRDPTETKVAQGRQAFGSPGLTGLFGVSCASCHGGDKWTRSRVDFAGVPSPDLGHGQEEIVGAELRRTLSQPGLAPTGVDGVLMDVGTFVAGTSGRNHEVRPNPADAGQRVNALGPNGFQAPSLLSVGATAPYFHSGIAKTLEQVLDGSFDGNGTSTLKSIHKVTSAAQRATLIEFLKSIDDTTPTFN